jgi:hypothetical protein
MGFVEEFGVNIGDRSDRDHLADDGGALYIEGKSHTLKDSVNGLNPVRARLLENQVNLDETVHCLKVLLGFDGAKFPTGKLKKKVGPLELLPLTEHGEDLVAQLGMTVSAEASAVLALARDKVEQRSSRTADYTQE